MPRELSSAAWPVACSKSVDACSVAGGVHLSHACRVDEADESWHWLVVLRTSGLAFGGDLEWLVQESSELGAIFARSVTNCRNRRPRLAPRAARTANSRRRVSAGQQQTREVGAGYQQHEGDGSLHHPNRSAGFADDLVLSWFHLENVAGTPFTRGRWVEDMAGDAGALDADDVTPVLHARGLPVARARLVQPLAA